MKRLGTRPTERCIEGDRSVTNATCPEVLLIDASETSLGVEALAVMGTAVSVSVLEDLVVPEQSAQLNDRIHGIGSTACAVISRSTFVDAAPEIDQFTRLVPTINLGFPTVEDPRAMTEMANA